MSIIHPIVTEIFKDENPSSIFEIGCASGALIEHYYNERTRLTSSKDTEFDRTRLKLGGVDKVVSSIEQAKLNFPEYADNFLVWDILNTPWPIADKAYDLVFTIGTLLMLPDPFPIVKEALRIGKKVVFAEFHDPDRDALGVNTSGWEAPLAHHRYYRDYEKVLKQFGIKPTIKMVEDKWVIRCQS
jgi:SAM-dependent methyltransferase